MSSNAFATAMFAAANTTTGDNGALMVKDSGNPFVTYFTNIVKSSERAFVTKAVDEMVAIFLLSSASTASSVVAATMVRVTATPRTTFFSHSITTIPR